MERVYLSLGSNIGRHQHITAALDALHTMYGHLLISTVYESVAVGFTGDPFLNLVVGIDTAQSVAALSTQLHQIEADNGRRRDGPKFSARTLDIDILTYGDHNEVIDGIVLPREEILRHAFVLLPMSELAPAEKHPGLQRSYAELWHDFDAGDQQLWPVEFIWQGKKISSNSA